MRLLASWRLHVKRHVLFVSWVLDLLTGRAVVRAHWVCSASSMPRVAEL